MDWIASRIEATASGRVLLTCLLSLSLVQSCKLLNLHDQGRLERSPVYCIEPLREIEGLSRFLAIQSMTTRNVGL